MKTLKFPSRMDPSITQPRKDRARAALSARGNATKTRFAGFGTKQCGLQTLSWFACCALDFQGRIETLGKVGRRESQLNSAKWKITVFQ